jgi:hypothetical protein
MHANTSELMKINIFTDRRCLQFFELAKLDQLPDFFGFYVSEVSFF